MPLFQQVSRASQTPSTSETPPVPSKPWWAITMVTAWGSSRSFLWTHVVQAWRTTISHMSTRCSRLWSSARPELRWSVRSRWMRGTRLASPIKYITHVHIKIINRNNTSEMSRPTPIHLLGHLHKLAYINKLHSNNKLTFKTTEIITPCEAHHKWQTLIMPWLRMHRWCLQTSIVIIIWWWNQWLLDLINIIHTLTMYHLWAS